MARKQPQKGFTFTREMVQDSDDLAPILRKFKSDSWDAYHELPFPTIKDEAWRRTSLNGLDFGSIQLPNGQIKISQDAEKFSGVLSKEVISGKSYFLLDSSGVQVNLSADLKKKGVILSRLSEAASTHPELVEKLLGKVVSPRDGIFAAVVGAFAKFGVFIYIPKGVQVKEPIFGISIAPGQRTAHLFQTLIYMEEGSSLNYLQETRSSGDQSEISLAGENLEIFVGPNANLQITELQNYGSNVWSFGHKKALVERDGNLEWEIGALGSVLCKHFVSLDLIGKGAEGRISGLFFADQTQHLSYNTLQRHLAPWTTSDLLFKGALNGKSRSVWRGMIYVAPGAQHIDGYQANRNLVLDPAARSDSIPGLEILNNDVRCTHGSTIGKVDQDQLFYLLSRGIPKQEAEQLVIQGFFNDILTRFPIPEVGEAVWSNIKSRLLD
ncbi:MAG TPA: Fe-S cluster assembly protein SufD [Chloroflexi bacterium]|nr:Fe-S cluster assembly protein SufD [Chloroflexota bacterium]